MCAELLLAAAFQVGPFYEQGPGMVAVRPFYAREGETTDVLWPLLTSHRDWWRFCYVLGGYSQPDGQSQFSVFPLWFNGTDRDGSSYAGLFPVYGHHPHFALMYDLDFVLWPVWMRYRTPRPSTGEWITSSAVLWPFVSWRSDGSFGVWPVCGLGRQRESDHRYALWPLVTWATYREDRDTAGAGSSWMVWPLYGRVRRERERQDLVLPPLFSYAETRQGAVRLRCPWPFFERERSPTRDRLSVWPLYERSVDREYADGRPSASVTRFGWKLVELYDDETRVFPFWVSRRDGSYFRLWPLWESETRDGATRSRALSLVPIRWIPAVDRNWAKFWTFYERTSNPVCTDHSLLWGLIRWRTVK